MSTTLVHDLLRASAERFPPRTAVVDGERSVTYTELDATFFPLLDQVFTK